MKRRIGKAKKGTISNDAAYASNLRRSKRAWLPFVRTFAAVHIDLGNHVDALARKYPDNPGAFQTAVEALPLTDIIANPLLAAYHQSTVGIWGPVYTRTRRDTFREALAAGEIVNKRAHPSPISKADPASQADLIEAEWVSLQVGWTMQQGAEQVVEITWQAREAIKEVVADGLIGRTWPPTGAAVEIKKKIGLHKRWQDAVNKKAAQWHAEAEQGLITHAEAKRRTEAYYERLLRRRAQTIARTEAMDSINAATMAAWQQDIQEGVLLPSTVKVWEARDPCPICTDLALQPPVPINEPFTSEYLATPLMRPPAHPNCKCSMGRQSKHFAQVFGDLDQYVGRPPVDFRNPDSPRGMRPSGTASTYRATPRVISDRHQDHTGTGPPPLTAEAAEGIRQRLARRAARGGSTIQPRPPPVPTFG